MKDVFSSPTEAKAFGALVAGSLANWLSSAPFVQTLGFLVAVAGLIVQASAYIKNRAETRRSHDAAMRDAERHELEMKVLRKQLDTRPGDLHE